MTRTELEHPVALSLRVAVVTAYIVLAVTAPVARGAWLSIVNLDTWQGGEPTAEDLAGLTLPLGETARLGIVIELMDGVYEDTGEYVENRLSFAAVYLDVLRWPQSLRIVSTEFLATNDVGERWINPIYHPAIANWLHAPDAFPAPFLDIYSITAFDNPISSIGHAGVGNRFSGRKTILLSEIVVEAVSCCDQVGSVVFSVSVEGFGYGTNLRMLPQYGEFVGHGGHSVHAPAGYLYLRNGRSSVEGFDIAIEPGESGACCGITSVCRHESEEICRGHGGEFYGVGKTCATQVAGVTIVEPGGEVFNHAIGVKLDCPVPTRGIACENRPYHVDAWTSDPHSAMCQHFGVNGSPAIPAGFFAPDSVPFTNSVCLRGRPLGETEHGAFGTADTLILRDQDPFDFCDAPTSEVRSVAIRPLALSLESVEPVRVIHSNGASTFWNLHVDLSQVYEDEDPTNDPPWGTLWATKSHCNGGLYTSQLPVQARFTFTKIGSPVDVRVLDTGLAGIPPVMLDARNMPRTWVSRIGETLAVANPVCSDFQPGVRELNIQTACDCNSNGVHDSCEVDCDENGRPDTCDIELDPARDCNANGILDACDLAAGTSVDLDDNQIPDECQCQSHSDCPPAPFCAGPVQCINLICRPSGPPCPEGTFCDEANDACFDCLVDSNCINSNYCDGLEQCAGGVCVAGEPPCQAMDMVCHEAFTSCVECLDHTDCDDVLFCTGVETCVNHECRPGVTPCEEGWLCDESLDSCVCDDDGDCDDGLFCNGPDRCVGGVCVSAGDPCAGAGLFCSEVQDECVECLTNSHCNDNRFCTGVETCANGECHTSGDPCTPQGLVCDIVADACRCDDHGDCADDIFCNGGDWCAGGFCMHAGDPCAAQGLYCVEATEVCVECIINAHCADGLFCNGGEVCLAGECFSVGNPCTPIGFACDEAGDRCICDDGGDCADGQFCNGVERCQGGACVAGTNPCLAQGLACDEVVDGCYECRTTSECNDGLTCNGFETCVGGMCVAGSDPCGHGTYCSEAIGGCVACTADVHCDDGSFCNGAEWCNAGQCVPGRLVCPADRCDEAADRCLACATDAHCDDGDFCNGAERCVNEVCLAGAPPCPGQPCSEVLNACVVCTARIHCDDGDACTEDGCESFVCRHVLRRECGGGDPPIPVSDSDGDGVPNELDECPGTPGGEVDERGCSCAHRDPDGDGISDCFDECPDSPPGSPRDAFGCTAAQRDADGDGVQNRSDLCPDTPRGVAIDLNGCAVDQAPSAEELADQPVGRGAVGGCGLLGMLPLAVLLAGLRLMRGRRAGAGGQVGT